MSIKRDFHLVGTVVESSVQEIIKGIIEINRYDLEQARTVVGYKGKPITIVVDTFGGSAYDGLGLSNLIQSSKTPVHTYCYSKAMSVGLVIFASGHKRFAHAHARFMYHQVSTTLKGYIKDIVNDLQESFHLQKEYDFALLSRSKLPEDKMKNSFEYKDDWFFSGEEGFKYQLVDELL